MSQGKQQEDDDNNSGDCGDDDNKYLKAATPSSFPPSSSFPLLLKDLFCTATEINNKASTSEAATAAATTNITTSTVTSTSTIYYCVQCRGSEPDVADGSNNNNNNSILRCSRCKVVHYCSRDCQKANFPLHKSWCKKIEKYRNNVEKEMETITMTTTTATATTTMTTNQYHLAHLILELGYRSTDTIERGKSIYEYALMEYYKLIRMDPFFIGACESFLLLSSILGYDNLFMAFLHFFMTTFDGDNDENGNGNDNENKDKDNHDRHHRENAIRHYILQTCQNVPMDAWIFGDPVQTTNEQYNEKMQAIILTNNIQNIQDLIPKYWGINIVLIPIMLMKVRQWRHYSTNNNNNDNDNDNNDMDSIQQQKLQQEIIQISRNVEHAADMLLPVLRSLFPDSRERWGMEEACTLLAHVDYPKNGSNDNDKTNNNNKNSGNDNDDSSDEDDDEYSPNLWEQHCYTFWMMLKDCYAFTPGLLDSLEDIIDIMDSLGIPPLSENPPGTPTTGEYMKLVKAMADHQKEQEQQVQR